MRALSPCLSTRLTTPIAIGRWLSDAAAPSRLVAFTRPASISRAANSFLSSFRLYLAAELDR